ncbi:MAG TPA: prolyl oligopeptidase family serine peptidase [Polyangia bacterium]|nr:prolyl oligopeptidase family serine peptidase [Polyangia bacterium]
MLLWKAVSASDPFAWLEDGEAPAVQQWTHAQNARTRAYLDALPGRAALAERFRALYGIGSLGVPVSRPHRHGRRLFYTRRDGGQNQPVLYVRDGDGPERALVDVNREFGGEIRAIDWWFPSDDGARVAYGVSADGSEESTLRVRDVASGHDLPDLIARTRACSLAWMPDGGGFYYTRYPRPGEVPANEEQYHRAVFHHRLGDDPARDAKIFGEGLDRTDWPNVDLSPDGRWLAINVSQGWSKSELWLIDRAAAGTPAVSVAAGEQARFDVVEVRDDRLYVLTTSGAPRGRIVAVDPQAPQRARWRDVVPAGDDVLEQAVYFQGGLAVASLHDAAARLRLFDADGGPRGEVPLPGLGALTGLTAARDAAEVHFGFAGFFAPTTVFRVVPGHAPAVWRALPSPVDAAAFDVERVIVTSRDGTRLPLFLAHRKGVARDGSGPAVLYGYGGFAIDMLPTWTPSAIPFLERGGTYAVAVLRGGGEYGEDWHRAGMLDKKQNVFDDFIAAATWLVDHGVTRPQRLAISGGSNGGLLVGAALTQRPDLFRAVVCKVPLLDMLRYHRFRIGALWIPEYGSPDDPQAARWLAAYSPYHRVRDGVAYPAVLLQTAESDTRVDPMHARKMAARLQAAQRGDRPILLEVQSRAGHGAGKPVDKVIAEAVDTWSFVFDQLSIEESKR